MPKGHGAKPEKRRSTADMIMKLKQDVLSDVGALVAVGLNHGRLPSSSS